MMLSMLSYVCFDKLHVQIFCSFKKMQLFVSFLLSLKWKVNWLSPVWLFVTPWTVAHQAPQSMGFSRQEYRSGLPFPSPGDLPNPGIKPGSPALQADTLPSEPPGKSIAELRELLIYCGYQFFIRYVIYKHFLLLCNLSLYFLTVSFEQCFLILMQSRINFTYVILFCWWM